MTALILIVISLVVFAGFILLTHIEARRGGRLFATQRATLDDKVMQATLVLTHVDLGAFARSEAKRLGEHGLHEIAHLSLQGVRTVERLLTQAVRELRTRVSHHETLPPGESTRDFVKALNGFKRELVATRPPELG